MSDDVSSPEYHANSPPCRPAERPKRRQRSTRSTSFKLSPDVVESIEASGPGYSRRVEQALRKAGFGAAKTKPTAQKPLQSCGQKDAGQASLTGRKDHGGRETETGRVRD
jgi:hypothetical protein